MRAPYLQIDLTGPEPVLFHRTDGGFERRLPLGSDGLERLARAYDKVRAWYGQHPGIELRHGYFDYVAEDWGIGPDIIQPLAIIVEYLDEKPRWDRWAASEGGAA